MKLEEEYKRVTRRLCYLIYPMLSRFMSSQYLGGKRSDLVLDIVKWWCFSLICISRYMRSWNMRCLIPWILFHMLFALWFSLWFNGLSFAFLCSSSMVNLGGYEVSLYACLSALFWLLCSVASLLFDRPCVGIGKYSIIGSTSCL